MTEAINTANTTRRDLWATRTYYFLIFGGFGFVYPFLNIFYNRLGLTGVEIGWISSCAAMTAMIGAPLLAQTSSRFSRPRLILQILLGFAAVLMLALGYQRIFVGCLFFYGIMSFFLGGASPIADNLAVTVSNATRSGYGSIRLFGSFSWALIAFISGMIIEKNPIQVVFWLCAITWALNIFSLLWVDPRRFSPSQDNQNTERLPLGQTLRALLRKPPMIGLALMMIAFWMLTSGVFQFENVFMDHLGAPESIIGLGATLSAAIEVPSMLLADRLLRRFRPAPVLAMSMGFYLLLKLSVFLIPSVVMVVITKSLTGLPYAFYTVGLIAYISENSSEQEKPTTLALYTITLYNLLLIISTPMMGLAFDQLGGRWLYAFAAAGNALGVLCMLPFVKRKPDNAVT